MRKGSNKSPLKVEKFADHEIISQPNPLGGALSYRSDDDSDDPIERAERALQDLAVEFTDWMDTECKRLVDAHAAVREKGFSNETISELFRAAHDIKGDAATFGYPTAAVAAESLCRIIEHAPDVSKVPEKLITHHIDAIAAIVREQARLDVVGVADELNDSLRKLADDYLLDVNRDRPEWLLNVNSPSLAPQG